jgi:hypothetical protein
MSDAETAPTTTQDAHDADGSAHGHEPTGEPLGQVDVVKWGYAVVGGAVGVVVALALFAAAGG